MALPLPPDPRAGRGWRSPRGLALATLATAWLVVGLAGAVRYVDSYYQFRGFAQLRDPGGVTKGHLVRHTFFSTGLGRQASYLVYLPPGYDLPSTQGHRFPTFYLLHGAPGMPENFLKIAGMGVRLDILVARHQVAPMLLVMPDGRIGGDTASDTEWANGLRGRYADFVLDVVADVDRSFRSKAVRTARTIAGYSEGAYGAVNVGLHQVATFAGIQSWSGYYVEGRAGTFSKSPPAALSANSPLEYAASLGRLVARHPLRVFLYTGRRDPLAPQMAPLVAELRAAGVEADSAAYPGAHDWALWRGHATQMLLLAGRDFALAPRLAVAARGAAARRALLAGVAVAEQARLDARRAAAIHDRQVTDCRARVGLVAASASDELVQLSLQGRRIVHHHLVRVCLTAPARVPLSETLCARLPSAIAIRHRAVLGRRGAVTARCVQAVTAAARPRG